MANQTDTQETFSSARRMTAPKHGSSSSRGNASAAPKAPSGVLIYLLPIFLVPALFIKLVSGQALQALVIIVCIIALVAAAMLIKGGLKIDWEYDQRSIAKAAPFPSKLFAYLIIASSVFATIWLASSYDFLTAVLFGLMAGGSAFFAYGSDRLKNKTLDEALTEAAGVTSERLLKMTTEAREKVLGMQNKAADLTDRDIARSIDGISNKAETVISLVEQDPKDLNQSRRFFVTYLDQVELITEKFADQEQNIAGSASTSDLKQRYGRVLSTVDQAFAKQIEKLKANDFLDLDVDIEVLQTQLDKEGIA